jgi:hypothetical protein
MAAAGAALGQANVACVYLVHGTFCGNDLLGLWTELARVAPRLSERLRRITKAGSDVLVGESGNYTHSFAVRMQESLSAGAGRTIPVRLFHWSSQNNHIARADGAVRLIDELARCAASLAAVPAPSPSEGRAREGGAAGTSGPSLGSASPPPLTGEGSGRDSMPRIQVWSHSHGGNVLALMTNLLGGDVHARREFFEAARPFYHRWRSSSIDFPAWERVETLLASKGNPLDHTPLDLVTFGTPIRYGWDAAGYATLLHVHNHKPASHLRGWLAAHPPRWGRLFMGGDGDFIQRIGVAGSGFPPLPIFFRTFAANSRLRRLVARGAPSWLWHNLKHGSRVPEEGTSLLIDYDEPGRMPLQHLFGHVLYTRRRWLPLHCELIAEELYREVGEADA